MNVGGMNQGMGPLQDKFVQNVQQQMGTLKTSKELKDEKPIVAEDKVDISVDDLSQQDHLEAASHSGIISEYAPKLKKKEQTEKKEVLDEVIIGAGKNEKFDAKLGKIKDAPESDGKIIKGLKIEDKVNLENLFPKQKLEAANKVVMGQIQNTKPTPSLTELKAAPETAAIEGMMKEYHPMMGIHDSGNRPIAMLDEATL